MPLSEELEKRIIALSVKAFIHILEKPILKTLNLADLQVDTYLLQTNKEYTT